MQRILKNIGQTACLMFLVLQLSAFAQNTVFDSGMKSAQAGDFQSAIVYLRNSLTKSLSTQKRAQTHYNIGFCFFQLKQLDKAVVEFEQAVSLNQNYEKAFYALGVAYSDAQNWSRAENALLKSLKLAGGRSGEAWFDLAVVYVGQKKYDEAFAGFQQAIKFGTVAAPASYNNLGVIYAMNGDLQLGLKEIERAKNLGDGAAEDNLEVLRSIIKSGDQSLIAKLILNGSAVQ